MDETAFERLVSAHYEGLYRFALTLVRRGEEAADLTQETFYRYATKGSQLRDASKARSWLYTTLYRQFLMSRRHETRFPHTELVEAHPGLPSVEPDSVNRLDTGAVLEALQRLEETYRVPLTLFYLGDHSYRDIAGILDVPVGTIMSRLSRGKALLRRQLAAVSEPSGADTIIPVHSSTRSQGNSS